MNEPVESPKPHQRNRREGVVQSGLFAALGFVAGLTAFMAFAWLAPHQRGSDSTGATAWTWVRIVVALAMHVAPFVIAVSIQRRQSATGQARSARGVVLVALGLFGFYVLLFAVILPFIVRMAL